MNDSALQESRKRIAKEEDWSFFRPQGTTAPATTSTTTTSTTSGGWQLNPHQSRNDLKQHATHLAPPGQRAVVSAWDPIPRPPSPPSPTHYSNNLSPSRKCESPEPDNRPRQPSPFKVPRSPSRKRRKVSFADKVEVIPLKDQDLPVTSEGPSEPQPSGGEKSVDGETSSLISMLVSSIPTEKKEKDRKYFNKAKTDQPATDAQDTTRKEKETEEDEERVDGEKDHDLEMFDEEDSFLNAFMKAEKPKADKADRPSSSDEPEKKVEKEPKEKKKFNFKF